MVGKWLVALGLAACLAGCVQTGEDGQTGRGQDDLPALAATETTGVIRGVVVDDAIRPVANVTVAARGPEAASRTAVTDGNGFFGFADLVPGTWFLTAEKVAYTTTQQSVEVVAGIDEPPVAKLQVVFNPGEVPFYTELKIEAFVQCIIPGANLCAIINFYPCLVGYCDPLVDDTSGVFLFDELVGLQRNPDWYQSELVWESTQAVSPQLALRISPHAPEDGSGIDDRAEGVEGPSPLLFTRDTETARDWDLGTEKGVIYEVFGHMEETEAIGSLGFVVNQRATFFVHIFYGYTPPEGWQFSVDGSAPQPPQ